MLNKEDVFALETVLMAVLLSVAGWAAVEIIEIEAAIAKIETEQVIHNQAMDVLSSVGDSLIRLEVGQTHLKEGMDSHSDELKDLTHHVRQLHLKEG